MQSSSTINPELLQKCPKDVLTQFLHSLVDNLCGGASPDYTKYESYWQLDQWWTVCNSCRNYMLSCVKNGKDESKIAADLGSAEVAALLVEVLRVRRDDIERSLIDRSLAVSQTFLKDFDWQVKLVMASDKISVLRQPVVSVDLHLVDKSASKTVTLELNSSELDQFIDILSGAQQALASVST